MPGLTDDERVKMAGQIGDPMAEKNRPILTMANRLHFQSVEGLPHFKNEIFSGPFNMKQTVHQAGNNDHCESFSHYSVRKYGVNSFVKFQWGEANERKREKERDGDKWKAKWPSE